MFYALNTITMRCAGNKEIKTIIKKPSLQKSMSNIIKGFVQIERKKISNNNNSVYQPVFEGRRKVSTYNVHNKCSSLASNTVKNPCDLLRVG